MSRSKTYNLTAEDLSKMITEAMLPYMSKNTLTKTNSFDKATVEVYKAIEIYDKKFDEVLNEYIPIAQEISKRLIFLQNNGLLKNVTAPQPQIQAPRETTRINRPNYTINEGRLTAGKGIALTLGAGLIGGQLESLGVPQSITRRLQAKRMGKEFTLPELIGCYGELSNSILKICKYIESYPQILATKKIESELSMLTIGASNPNNSSFDVASKIADAVSFGLNFLGPIGVASSILVDLINLSASFMTSGVREQKRAINTVGEQYLYIKKALAQLKNAIVSSDSQFKNNNQNVPIKNGQNYNPEFENNLRNQIYLPPRNTSGVR